MQEKNNYCLCSIVLDVLSKYGISKSQKEIAKSLTPGKKGFLANDNRIKELLKNSGFNYEFYWWNQTPLNEPDYLLREISENDGFVGIGDHAFRVTNFEDPSLSIINPANGSREEFNYYFLMNKLRNFDGGFGLIKKL